MFTISAFGDEISPDLDEQIRVLLRHDIHYLEVRTIQGQSVIDFSDSTLEVISHKLGDSGIGVSALASPIGKVPINADFAPHLERFCRAIEVASILGTGYIRMFSFYIPQGEDPANWRAAVLERWQQFLEAAKGWNGVLLHENEKGIYGDTARRCLDLLESLGSSRVKATFDPANFVQCGEEVYPRAFRLLRPYIAYLHIKDARYRDASVVPAGQGDGKLKEVLAELAHSGFDGFLSIEPHLNNSLPGGGEEQFAVAVKALRMILEQLS